MEINYSIRAEKLSKVTKQKVEEALYLAYKSGIVSRAPLGYSSAEIVLYGHSSPRKSLISIRNHSGMASLLITDSKGTFLHKSSFNINLGLELTARKIYQSILTVKHIVDRELYDTAKDFRDYPFDDTTPSSEGFNKLSDWQVDHDLPF